MIFNTVMGEGSGGLPEFAYTGQYQFIEEGKEGRQVNWKIRFLTSGVLTFDKLKTAVDVFLVGGGGGSALSHARGGGGGYTATFASVLLDEGTSYEIVIGAGGQNKGEHPGGTDGGDTSFNVNMIAKGGKAATGSYGWGGNGGSGGAGSIGEDGGVDGADGNGTSPGKGQGTTTRAFGEASGELYSTGGGSKNSDTGAYALPNTGDGGNGVDDSVGAGGGSGIAIIRNHREVAA